MLTNTETPISIHTYQWRIEDPNCSLVVMAIASGDQSPEQITTFFEGCANFIIADLQDEAVLTDFAIRRRDLLRGTRITITLRLHFTFIDPLHSNDAA
jgi:hypothetical protein